jgi:putative endonuclease
MHSVYIIYSPQLDKYYVGETSDLDRRLTWHNSGEFKGCYSSVVSDWIYFWSLECDNTTVARKIETHIKKMKSRAYYQNLKKYPEIEQGLLEKFKD